MASANLYIGEGLLLEDFNKYIMWGLEKEDLIIADRLCIGGSVLVALSGQDELFWRVDRGLVNVIERYKSGGIVRAVSKRFSVEDERSFRFLGQYKEDDMASRLFYSIAMVELENNLLASVVMADRLRKKSF